MRKRILNKEELYNLYIVQKLPISNIAELFKTSAKVIEQNLSEYNIPRVNNNIHLYMSLSRFIKKCKKRYGDKYDYSKIKFNTLNDLINVKCNNCGTEFKIKAYLFYQGQKECPNCTLEKIHPNRKTKEQFLKEVKLIHGDKYDFTEFEYKGAKIKGKVWCDTCKEFFYTTPSELLRRGGCPKCARNSARLKLRSNINEFIEKAKKIHGNKYDYSKSIYPDNKEGYIFIHCNKCGNDFWQKVGNHLNGFGCPKCTRSKKEEFISEYLKNHNIEYISEKRFKDCKDKRSLPFDFYLPTYNICIEFQGAQHYSPWYFKGKLRDDNKAILKFKIQQEHDQIKRDYCKEHNIKLIEIKYNENIEKRLEMELFSQK